MTSFIECIKLLNNYKPHQLSIPKKRQNGMALLMAIMIVALVAIISVSMLTQRQLQIYRTENLYFREQAYQYALAIEHWGVSVLSQDLEREKADKLHFDSKLDIWNTSLVDFDVEQATIDGTVLDLQGRFNLNNLVIEGQVDKQWEESYKRLLAVLDLPLYLSDTLVDWLDKNEEPTGSSGAEDIYYIALDKPYRTSNQALVNVSELFLVKNYDKRIIDILKPHVFVTTNVTSVNINTSTVQVLQAVIPGLLADQAQSILTQIEKKPFTDIDQFLKEAVIQDKAIESSQVSVVSNYFSLLSNVLIDKSRVSLQSIVNRDEQGSISVLSRQESIWYEKVTEKQVLEEAQ